MGREEKEGGDGRARGCLTRCSLSRVPVQLSNGPSGPPRREMEGETRTTSPRLHPPLSISISFSSSSLNLKQRFSHLLLHHPPPSLHPPPGSRSGPATRSLKRPRLAARLAPEPKGSHPRPAACARKKARSSSPTPLAAVRLSRSWTTLEHKQHSSHSRDRVGDFSDDTCPRRSDYRPPSTAVLATALTLV